MPKKKPLDSNSGRLTFHYRKGNLFRIIKADGAWGGITPRLDIQMTLYSERLPIPDLEEVELGETGTPKTIRRAGTTKGIVREVEAAVVMNGAVARSVGEWLIKHADKLDEAFEAAQEEERRKTND